MTADHLKTMLLARLPMWSEVQIHKDDAEGIVLVARLPAPTDARNLELFSAFRLEMSPYSASVGFEGDGPWISQQVPKRFAPQHDRMMALKANLEKWWFDAHNLIWAARNDKTTAA